MNYEELNKRIAEISRKSSKEKSLEEVKKLINLINKLENEFKIINNKLVQIQLKSQNNPERLKLISRQLTAIENMNNKLTRAKLELTIRFL